MDWGSLGNAYGLLRLPQMPELKGATIDSFVPSNIDLTKLKYKEKSVAKQRELKRKALLADPSPGFKKLTSREKATAKESKRPVRRQKKGPKVGPPVPFAPPVADMSDVRTSKRRSSAMAIGRGDDDVDDDDDTESILEEYRKVKKLKGRKITAAEIEDLEDEESDLHLPLRVTHSRTEPPLGKPDTQEKEEERLNAMVHSLKLPSTVLQGGMQVDENDEDEEVGLQIEMKLLQYSTDLNGTTSTW
ncbi:unnamed protein product [Hydatigera taeniaeformis]|uniref:Uncharacterized protein n=1 Tax=Hydatigena taeniaeformis TaxID=6205 RepID=A0A3P7G3X4_HYDTA|nr:unnamed protein product [Hydatigera taeniaeformis]